jgi:hypothetical protein
MVNSSRFFFFFLLRWSSRKVCIDLKQAINFTVQLPRVTCLRIEGGDGGSARPRGGDTRGACGEQLQLM